MWQAMLHAGRAVAAVAPAVLAGLVLVACGSTGPEGPFTLRFAGDASFHAFDGGNEVRVAVVLVAPDATGQDSVVARDSATASVLAVPSFSFRFANLLEAGTWYAVDYWFDSNGNDRCDAPPDDHQWRDPLGRVIGAVNRTVTFDAGAMTDVCGTFAADTLASP